MKKKRIIKLLSICFMLLFSTMYINNNNKELHASQQTLAQFNENVKNKISNKISNDIKDVNNKITNNIKNDIKSKVNKVVRKINAPIWKWRKDSHGWWYGNGAGKYQKGWYTVNGVWYWGNRSGYLWTYKGWYKCKSGWVYNNGSYGCLTSRTVWLYSKYHRRNIKYKFNHYAIWYK